MMIYVRFVAIAYQPGVVDDELGALDGLLLVARPVCEAVQDDRGRVGDVERGRASAVLRDVRQVVARGHLARAQA